MQITKELQEIGLSEKEASVYIALLELGKDTAQNIAKKSGVNRATTYFTIETLMKKGLASASNEGKKQYFFPEDPSTLSKLLEEEKARLEHKERHIKTLVRELDNLNVTKIDKPIVKYYIGKEGVQKMVHEYSNPKEKNSRIIYAQDLIDKLFTREEQEDFRSRALRHKIEIQALYTCSDQDYISQKTARSVLLDKKQYPLEADIAIFDNKIRITSLKDAIGIIIENSSITNTLKSVFDLAYKKAKEERTEKQGKK